MDGFASMASVWNDWIRYKGPWLLTLRLLNAVLIRTSFNPDEYWQGPEVAHAWCYGGHLTWEWETCIALRGVLHPGLFALLLALLPEWPVLVAYAPRLLQGAFASLADWAVYRSADRLGSPLTCWALSVQLTGWFQLYALPRTFSSSLEAVLAAWIVERSISSTSSSVAKWQTRQTRWLLLLGSLQVALRPTAAGFWLSWAIYKMYVLLQCGDLHGVFSGLLAPGLLISGVVLSFSTLLDCLYYGRFTLVPLNFLRFNLLADGSALYGSHPWHWYFTEGLAVTLGTFLPFCCIGLRAVGSGHPLRPLVFSAFASILLISLASHKEYRFLLPFFPLFSLLAGLGLQRASAWLQAKSAARARFYLLAVVFVPQVFAVIFFCVVHQRGAEAVMTHLRNYPARGGIFFLTACHATPFHSFLHGQEELGYLDCSPGRNSPQKRFFEQPMPVLRELFPEAQHNATEEGPPKGAALKPCISLGGLQNHFEAWTTDMRKAGRFHRSLFFGAPC